MKLQVNENNPRTITKEAFEQLKAKIKRNPDGLRANKIVYKMTDKENGYVIAGNQRLRAINELKLEQDPEWFLDATGWTDAQIREYLVISNVSDGTWDWDLLLNEYEPVELNDWGLEVPDWSEDKEVEEDEAPEVSSEPPVSKLGEIYQLGRHRVMCGDSTDFGAITDLLDGNTLHGVFTDPPYGMNAVSKSGVLSKTYKTDILGDDNIDVAKDSFKVVQELTDKTTQIWWGANYYSEVLPSSECWVVWNKNNGGSDQTDAELAWCNARSVVRMFTQSSEKKNRVHPTQKPVELSAWAFNQFKYGQNVLDLFLGSGSTLIACEQTDRTCYGMELDPKYVDVIRKRYAKFIQPDNELPENWEELTPPCQ